MYLPALHLGGRRRGVGGGERPFERLVARVVLGHCSGGPGVGEEIVGTAAKRSRCAARRQSRSNLNTAVLARAFGSQRGNQNMLSSIATLAYDCRRSAFFTEHLYAALQLIDRGALSASQLQQVQVVDDDQVYRLAQVLALGSRDDLLRRQPGERGLREGAQRQVAAIHELIRPLGIEWAGNDSYGGAVDTVTNHVVGTGFTPQCRISEKIVGTEAADVFRMAEN